MKVQATLFLAFSGAALHKLSRLFLNLSFTAVKIIGEQAISIEPKLTIDKTMLLNIIMDI